MALSNYTTTSFSSAGSVDIPANAQDITVELRGSKGSGGQASGGGGGGGGNARKGKFTLPNYTQRKLSFSFPAGANGGSGGNWSETITIPQTCNANSNISATFTSNGALSVSGAGTATIEIEQDTSDDPSNAGTSFSNANISGNVSGSANFSFSNGTYTDSAVFKAGTVGFNINGLQKPLSRYAGNTCLSLRDGDGDDTNTAFCINNVSQNSYSYDCSYTQTNNYSSGAGGKGGNAAVLKEKRGTGTNRTIAVAGGGGGGGGGHSRGNKSGVSGNSAASFGAAAISNVCNGNTGSTDDQGGGGGGAAGVCPNAIGGAGGTPSGSGGGGGNGGISAYNSSYISITQNTTTTDSSPSGSVKYRTITPEIDSFTSNKNKMINDGTDGITLKWSTTDAISVQLKSSNSNDASYSNYQNVAIDNTTGLFRQPTDDLTYTLKACTYGNVCVTSTLSIIVYQLPTSNFYADDETITIGTGGTNLNWELTGDGVDAEIDKGIGDILLTGTQAINPSSTTTYTLSLTSLGGDLTDSVTVTVYQLPQLQVSYPVNVAYDVDFDIEVKTKFCNTAVVMNVKQFYYSNTGTLIGDIVDITYDLGADGSSEFQADFREVTQTVSPAYNDLGPYRLDIAIAAGGDGGVQNSSKTFMVIIDMMPDPIIIPPNPDELPETDPVISPDETKSGFVGSPVLPINGIDIPVEIRADKAIQVRFDPDNPSIDANWKNLRQYIP